MSSRQEEKQRRREERLARERAEATAAARRKRLQYAFGGLLGLAALAGIVVLIASAAGGGGEDEAEAGGQPRADLPALPEQKETEFAAAAEKAGCELINAKYEGAGHEEKAFKPTDYQSNPPTSGTHFPTWYEDGIYAPGNAEDLGQMVHTLEHGRVNVQYKPGTPDDVVAKLEAFMAEQNDGYHMLLYENTTDMPYEVAATAWTQILGCEKYSDAAIDALRTFRARYIDQGPERVP